MKTITRLTALIMCAICVFSASADGTTQYCQKDVTSASSTQTIQLTCQQVSSGVYEMKIEAATAITGFGGSFFEVNGVGGTDIRTLPVAYSNENKTATVTITSNVAPKLYTPLYILMPGEVQFLPTNDIKWDVTCSGEAVVDLNLADLKIDGTTVTGFASTVSSYNVKLAAGTTQIPVVTATANDTENTTVTIAQAEALPGAATVTVTETANSANTKVYTVSFKVDNSGDNTECAGTLDEASQGSFSDGYTYEFSTDASKNVTVKFTVADSDKQLGLVAFAWTYNPDFAETPLTNNAGVFTGTFDASELFEKTTFKIACKFAYNGGMAVTKTFEYTVGNNCGADTPTSLDLVSLNYGGIAVENFDNTNAVYSVSLAEGTTAVPTVTAEASDAENTTIEITQATSLPGVATVKITDKKDSSRSKEFTINFTVPDPSGNTEYVGTTTGAAEGTFVKGYRYLFYVDANSQVTLKYKLLDEKEGVLAYAHTSNPDFAETQLTLTEDGYFTGTFDGTGLSTFKVAVKFAYAGGATISKQQEFEVKLTTGVANVASEKANVVVYPTHVTDILNVKADKNIAAVYVYSVNGSLVKKAIVNAEDITVNVSDLANGQYTVSVVTIDGKLNSQKILKY